MSAECLICRRPEQEHRDSNGHGFAPSRATPAHAEETAEVADEDARLAIRNALTAAWRDEYSVQTVVDGLMPTVAALTANAKAEADDLRSRLACVVEATYWDRPYDTRIAAIRGMCDLTTNGMTPAEAVNADGSANDCTHTSATGIDTTPYNDPSKVWACDHCGLRWTRGGPTLCGQCGEMPAAMVKVGTLDGWCTRCLDAAAEHGGIDAAHLERQREWSRETFGPGPRLGGVLDHIRRELKEVEERPFDVTEWADVLILAFDGAWRSGHEPQAVIDAIKAKQATNEARTWPDWRGYSEDEAIEHDRTADR